MADPIVTASSAGAASQTQPTPTTAADVANANALNQAISQVRLAAAANTTAIIAKINSIASAIPASMVGGTTGTNPLHVLLSKGTTGFALQPSLSMTVDTSAQLGGALQLTTGVAGGLTEYFRAKPSDWTTGKPYFAIKSDAAINGWQFILWDGTNANGTINFIVQNLEYNGNIVATTNQLPAGFVSPTVDIRTGSATITIPANATKLFIQLVGGGGGGGGCSLGQVVCGNIVPSVGGNGGAAGVLVKYLSGLTPGNTLALTIGGAGSQGAANGGNGGNGGNSTLASGSQSITTLTASGGTGGIGGGTGATGANGTAGGGTNGDLNWTGCNVGSFNTGLGFGYTSAGSGGGIGVATTGGPGLGYGGPGGGAFMGQSSGSTAHGGAGTAGVAVLYWYN